MIDINVNILKRCNYNTLQVYIACFAMLILVTETLQSPALRVKRDEETEEDGAAVDGDGGDKGNGGDDKEPNSGGSNGFIGNQIPFFGSGSIPTNPWVDGIKEFMKSNSIPVSAFPWK